MNDLFRPIVIRMNHLHLLHRIYIQRAAVENGLYFGQLPILEYISEHDRCTQSELAENLQVSAPSIATSVKRMQKAGLLEKVTDETDLRCNRISMTEKGVQLSRRGRAAFNSVDQRMFAGFNEEDCEKFCGYLDRLLKNITAEEFQNKTMFALISAVQKENKQQEKGEEPVS